MLRDRLAEAGATGYELRVLSSLAGQSLSQADIGRATALDRRDVTTTIGALETEGLIARSGSASDARVLVVSLTRAGRARLRRLSDLAAAAQQDLLAPLTARQRETFVELLTRIAAE